MSARLEQPARAPRVLVIGGTQFMGRAAVAALLESGRYEVTVLNRGRTESPFDKGRVRHVRCDRRKKALGTFLASEPAFSAVLDFVAFCPDDVARLLPHAAKLGLYVLISTDSVYMACDPAGWVRGPSGRLLEASDAQPDVARGAADEYGAAKLELERTLRDAALPYVAVRLPDVLGEHENTGRQQKLFKRLLGGRRIGTAAEPGGDGGFGHSLPLSVVFAADVAAAAVALVEAAAEPARVRALAGAALHVCADEAPTWAELVQQAAEALRALGLPVPAPRFDAAADTRFVSVECGALDNGAAAAALPAFRPAPLAQRLRETAAWWVEEQRAAFEAEQRDERAADDGGGAPPADGPAEAPEPKRSRAARTGDRGAAQTQRFSFGFDE